MRIQTIGERLCEANGRVFEKEQACSLQTQKLYLLAGFANMNPVTIQRFRQTGKIRASLRERLELAEKEIERIEAARRPAGFAARGGTHVGRSAGYEPSGRSPGGEKGLKEDDMKMIEMVMSTLGASDDANPPTPPPAAPHQDDGAVSAARASLAAAERDSAAAQGRRNEADAALAAAEGEYDLDETEENGGAVIQARHARDLADLKADRAAKRVDAARVALEAAERTAKRTALEAQLSEAQGSIERASRRVAEAQEEVKRAHPEVALRVLAAADRATARAELAAAIEARRGREAERDAIEGELSEVCPELAEVFRESAALRSSEVGIGRYRHRR